MPDTFATAIIGICNCNSCLWTCNLVIMHLLLQVHPLVCLLMTAIDVSQVFPIHVLYTQPSL